MKKNVIVQMNTTDYSQTPIARIVQVANSYKSRIYLEMGNARANAKSIMGVMGLAMINGEQVVIHAEGEDEAEAVSALEEFLRQ
jgi:phosphotransferase system HPr (HPr) family protein